MALETLYDPNGNPKTVSDSEIEFFLANGWSLTPPKQEPGITIGGGTVTIESPSTDFDTGGTSFEPGNPGKDLGFGDQAFEGLLPDKTGKTDGASLSEATIPWWELPGLIHDKLNAENTNLFDHNIGGSGGGRGGGGGGAQRVFAQGDPRDIEEAARDFLIARVGKANPSRVAELTRKAQDIQRHNFDNPENQLSWQAEWRQTVRAYEDYRQIHELRPESIDETEWLSTTQGALLRAGLAPNLLDDQSIALATAGVNPNNIANNVNVGQIQRTGQAPGFTNQFRQAASVVARMIR